MLIFSQFFHHLRAYKILFFQNQHDQTVFCTESNISYEFYKKKSQNAMMGSLVVVGLQELRTVFGNYEQFVGL